jgi:hypothetical protein
MAPPYMRKFPVVVVVIKSIKARYVTSLQSKQVFYSPIARLAFRTILTT